jgi:hypothetical protein
MDINPGPAAFPRSKAKLSFTYRALMYLAFVLALAFILSYSSDNGLLNRLVILRMDRLQEA